MWGRGMDRHIEQESVMNTEKVFGVYFTFTQSWCPDSLYLHTPRLTLPEN